jgi:hypothetical protein
MMMTDPENLCAESRVKAFGLQRLVYLNFLCTGRVLAFDVLEPSQSLGLAVSNNLFVL